MIPLEEFCVLIFAALFLALHTEATDSIRDVEAVETLFTDTFVYRSFFSLFWGPPVPPSTLCNLPKETKLAICNMLLQREHYVRELIPNIYLNKAAAYYRSADCEEKLITFRARTNYNADMVTHNKMIPCYGLHHPIRTNWRKDDYFDAFYIAEGPKPDSVFIFDRTKTVFQMHGVYINEYSLLEYVKNIDIANLTSINFNEEDVKNESKLRKIVTFNVDYKENEVNYIRERNHVIVQSNAICNLEKYEKLLLCKKMFNRDTYRIDFLVHDTAMLTRSTACEYKEISFSYVVIFNPLHLLHNMFPCYGTSFAPSTGENSQTEEYVSIFYLAEGTRENSIILFRRNDDMITHSIVEIAENVFLGLCTVTKNIIIDAKRTEELFIETFLQSEYKLNSLCDLPKEKKLAICQAVLSQPDFDYRAYFNKAAAFFLSPDCVEIPILFAYEHNLHGKPPIQKALPCYGRSNPIRTNWDIDDKFDKIYLSGGHEDDSLFVYKKFKSVNEDEYYPYHIIQDAGIENLLPSIIREEETIEELELLEIISCFTIRPELEILFLREVIRNNVQITNDVCEMENEKKLTLCKLVSNCYQDLENWVLDEGAFRSTECEEKSLKFEFEWGYNDAGTKIKMFPCHGKVLDPVSGNKIIADSEIKSNCDCENLQVQTNTDNENPSEQNEELGNEIKADSKTHLGLDCDCGRHHSSSSSNDGDEKDKLPFYLSGSHLPNSVLVYQKSSGKRDRRALYYLVENLRFSALEHSIIPEPQT